MIGEKIGSGAFSDVYRANVYDNLRAIKILKPGAAGRESCLTEVRALDKLRHENIVTFYGVVLTEKECGIVMELCNGTLYEALYQNPNDERVRTVQQRLRIEFHVIQGMRYLHDQNCVHADLKSPSKFKF